MELERALETAVAAAREAGALLGDDFHRPEGARGKGDKADADVEAERAIRARLEAAFPDWGYLGEETGRRVVPGAPVWLVDPNDGTRDYLLGRRGSAVSIGVAWEGRPVLGVVFAFNHPDDRGDLFAWAEGCGPLQRNGRVSDVRLPEVLGPYDVVLVSNGGDRQAEANLRWVQPARFRSVPSIAHRLALVAGGDAAAATSLYAPGAWDYGAGHALLRGAGGVLLDEAGQEVRYAADGASRVARAFGGSAAVAGDLARRVEYPDLRGRPMGPPPLRLERGRTVRDAGVLGRAHGCLLGQVAGDSLGSLVEFQRAPAIAERYADGPRRLEDGGTFDTLAGQPTDDSEMALALGRSLVDRAGFEPADVLRAYREWMGSEPFDMGGTTRAALEGRPDARSQANGSLMRVSPLAVFAHARAAREVAALARAESALTHPHPVCGASVAAFTVAVAHAVRTGSAPGAVYEEALACARAEGVAEVVETLERAAGEAPVCDGSAIGWVRIALQNAFFELLHAASLEEGVVRTVRRGGDTDTNAAIAGALLGAVHGRDAVPAQWRHMVLTCRAHPLRARRPRPQPYWPIDLPALAERLLLAGQAWPNSGSGQPGWTTR